MTLQSALDTALTSQSSTHTAFYVRFDWRLLSKADNPQPTLTAKVKACGYTLLQFGTDDNGRYLVVRKD